MSKKLAAVSNLGRFRRNAVTNLPQIVGPSGCVEINGHKYFLDRLVCRAFLGPPPPGIWEIVEHLYYNSENNLIENLAWLKKEIWKNIDCLPENPDNTKNLKNS